MRYGWRKAALAVACVLACSSCASAGHRMSQGDIDKIVVGTTTKDEMMQIFGTPVSQTFGAGGHLTMSWFYVSVGPFGTNMKQQNLAVMFDKNNRVEKFNLIDNTGANRIRTSPP